MNTVRFRKPIIFLAFSILSVCAWFAPGAASGAQPPTDVLQRADRIIEFGNSSGGVAAVVADRDAELGMALAMGGSFTVQCLHRGEDRCKQSRRAIRSAGMYGRVSADTFDLPLAAGVPRLPYTQNLVNLLVVDRYPALSDRGLTVAEILRVMSPLGAGYVGSSRGSDGEWIGTLKKKLRSAGATDLSVVRRDGVWVRFRKDWPSRIDDWSHYLHGADGNPVAQDKVVGPPRHFQWKSGPMWMQSHETDSSVTTMVTSRGRLFYIANRAPISLAGNNQVPDKWFLVARDAFNGVVLWKVPIRRWGWRQWKKEWFSGRPSDVPFNIQKCLVASENHVFVTLGYRAPVTKLDGRTGEILHTYEGTKGTSEILLKDGTLVLSVLEGDTVRLRAVDAETGEHLWATDDTYKGTKTDYVKAWRGPAPDLDPTLNTATDGTVVALIDGGDIVGVDFETGRQLWRTDFPLKDADKKVGGIDNSDGHLWVGTMIVKNGVVLHASPNRLGALSAETGKTLWTRPKRYIGHLWYEWKDIFVIDGLAWTWSADLDSGKIKGNGHKRWPASLKGYDLQSGEVEENVKLGPTFKSHHHHRCYRNKATSRFIFASRRGTEFVDLQGPPHEIDNWVRGTCHVGMMPANGLQYAPIHPCVCYSEEKLRGMNVLAPARPEKFVSEEGDTGHKLKKGAAYAEAAGPEAGPEDWPAFRHDARRTGSTHSQVSAELKQKWRVDAGLKLSSVTAADGRLYAALIDQHHVICLDAETGQKLWEYPAGARVDSPPTYHRGKVIFGSRDGWVYCLRARDGALAWRLRAAPGERLVGAFGQLESAWPVHGSILVRDGKAYFAAGRSSHLDGGIRLYAVDVQTGSVAHKNTIEGPRYTSANIDVNYQLPQGLLPDVMMSSGSSIYMHGEAFTRKLEPTDGQPKLRASNTTLLDDNYFKRTPWRYGGDYGRLIVHDRRNAYYVRQFDSLRGLDPDVYFTPGSKGYLLFGKDTNGDGKTWSNRVPVRIKAMVHTQNHLFVSGPPDILPASDPLGPFEGRKGGLLYAVDAATGDRLQEYNLPFPPIFNGLTAAGGRLYISDKNGNISCYAPVGE